MGQQYSAVHNVWLGGVEFWDGGPYWAECNVGANTPEECGYYLTMQVFNSVNCPNDNKSNSHLQSEVYIDSAGSLTAAHDARIFDLHANMRGL